MEKKGSDHFRDILNPYGEKPNYGKIGRRRRLSKLNVFFFHNSVGYHTYFKFPSNFIAGVFLLARCLAPCVLRSVAVLPPEEEPEAAPPQEPARRASKKRPQQAARYNAYFLGGTCWVLVRIRLFIL